MTKSTAGLCLTFDDRFILSWYRALELFDRYDAKATFFVCWPHTLRWRDWRMLREIAAAGHEIGCHTLQHVRLRKYLETSTVDAYLGEQIDPAIECMARVIDRPTSFAYPYFRFRSDVTNALLDRFTVVRQAAPIVDWKRRIVPAAGARVVNTLAMTDKTGMDIPISYFQERFAYLAEHGGYGVTCGHTLGNTIPKNPKMRCTNEDLEIILALAKAYGLTFHTMTEMAIMQPAEMLKTA